jgi:hypothetical protein
MRAIGFITAAVPDIDLVAPKGSLIRATDVSEETGLAFHTGRFLGTAPRRAARRASRLLPWRVLRDVAVPGCRVYSR